MYYITVSMIVILCGGYVSGQLPGYYTDTCVTESPSNNNRIYVMYYDIFAIFTPQLAGKAHQLGCPKIVLDHVRVYIYIYIYIYICLCTPQCLSTHCIGNT